jgi:hypothetical protein
MGSAFEFSQLLQLDQRPAPGGKRVLYQMPKNPADKATIVSILPKKIIEYKPTIFPGTFVLESAEGSDFVLLVINGSSYYKPSGIDKAPPTEIQINAAALADSIVNDFIGATWLASKGTRGPGIFWIPGEYDRLTIRNYKHVDGRTFDELMDDARAKQRAWFLEIMDHADSFWAASNGNPRSIPEDARIAAKFMGVESSKPWMVNVVASRLENCPACGEMINLEFPVCKHCHAVVNKKRAEELGLTFAKG